MPSPTGMLVLAASAAAAVFTSTAYGAEDAPVGFWRTTNQCFLALLS